MGLVQVIQFLSSMVKMETQSTKSYSWRASMVSKRIMGLLNALKVMPSISDTERTALDAGQVWFEAELFSGSPDFRSLADQPFPELTEEEQAFLDGPVQELCVMLDDWAIWSNREMPKKVWKFLAKHKFFGMIIPKDYGGLGFSAIAHSAVIQKLGSRSIPAAITVMVPNSLGPAELLIHYGTEEQKQHYLPRLAAGDDIPCFALTEPGAGSDAGALTSEGVVFKQDDGSLGLKLTWNKRWITLAAVSTVLGLAFRVRDPENLLGKGEDLGITCALIPTKTPGVIVGRRHDPLSTPFYNCPTQGKEVEIGLDAVIGGEAGIGGGWTMLMECLAAGRGISLPALSTGGTKLLTRVVTAHSTVRKQFGLPIGKFEGVEEPLARLVASTYMLDALRKMTLTPLDNGVQPPVATAMAKYWATELGRQAVNDAMDIMGGAGISLGPKNVIAQQYMSMPISITVEGANILTRTLMIFGQGALRCHPYAYKEVKSLEADDVEGFDSAFWGHIWHVVKNKLLTTGYYLTRGHLIDVPTYNETRRYYQLLTWSSTQFALLADAAMGSLGAKLKLREKVTGRFADVFSWMYICTAVLKNGKRRDVSKKTFLSCVTPCTTVYIVYNWPLRELQRILSCQWSVD